MNVARIRLRLVGECVIQIGERAILPSAPSLFALLLYLAVQRGRAVTRAEVVALLFQDNDASSASHNLRQLLYRLKQFGAPLQITPNSILVNRSSVHDDVEELAASEATGLRSALRTSHAVLPCYSPPTEPFSEWVDNFRSREQQKLMRRLVEDLRQARRGADWHEVDSLANACLELDPFNETATLCLAEALARTGSKQRAMTLLQQYEQDLSKVPGSLTLPPRLLQRRIAEPEVGTSIFATNVALVGRTHEMKQLASCWDRARRGNTTTVVVTGEGSIGKTRLASELLAAIRLEGSGRVFRTVQRPGDTSRPLSLFADLCKHLLEVPGAAGCGPASLVFLRRLTGVAVQASTTDMDEFSALDMDIGVRKAIADLLDSVASETALMLFIDDAHYLDEASLRMLRTLQEELSTRPLMFLICSRLDLDPPLLAATRLRLAPLEHRVASEIATAFVEQSQLSLPNEALAWCVERASGNPGHLELLLSHVARNRTITDVPLDLLALIDDKLSLLPATAHVVLQACAIYGEESSADAIAQLTGLSGYELLTALDLLEQHSLVLSTALGLRCRSVLIEERVVAGTGDAVRRLLHGRAATYLESIREGAMAPQAFAWRIAVHWREAGNWEASLRWLRACWSHLIAIGKPMAAVSGIRNALKEVTSLAERATLLDALAEALQCAGESEAQLEALSRRSALSESLQDSRITQLAIAFDTTEASFHNYEDSGPYIGALCHFVQARELDVRRRLRASSLLIVAADNAVEPALAKLAYEATNRPKPTDVRSRLYQLQARLIYHTVFGDRAKALDVAASVESLVRSCDSPSALTRFRKNVSLARRIVGDGIPDISDLVEAFEACQRAGMGTSAHGVAARIASNLFDDGCLEEAARWADKAHALAEDIELSRLSCEHLTSQIDLALTRGDFEQARSWLATIPHASPVYASPRMRKELEVYHVRVDQYRGATTGDATLKSLLSWHDRARHFGRHDDHMEVLWVALSQRGEIQRASVLLSEYLLRSRRELRPCNHLLRVRTNSDPVWMLYPAHRSPSDIGHTI